MVHYQHKHGAVPKYSQATSFPPFKPSHLIHSFKPIQPSLRPRSWSSRRSTPTSRRATTPGPCPRSASCSSSPAWTRPTETCFIDVAFDNGLEIIDKELIPCMCEVTEIVDNLVKNCGGFIPNKSVSYGSITPFQVLPSTIVMINATFCSNDLVLASWSLFSAIRAAYFDSNFAMASVPTILSVSK